jgi:hypothetical protein
MLAIPAPVGPLTQALFAYLTRRSSSLSSGPVQAELLDDRDAQLALYVANELHYGGVEDVSDDLEWEPCVQRLRTEIEDAMLAELEGECGSLPSADPETLPRAIFDLIAADDAPPLSRFLEGRASLEQFREFVMHRSAYQLKEADPHTFAIPRISGRAKSAMVEIQADEYGGGEPSRMHSALFAKTMLGLGLDPTPGAYVERLPASTLATVNLITLFALRRSLRGALVGHLTGFEITSPQPNRRYANGLRRLGYDGEVAEFYDEHVEADSVHENIAAFDLAGGLAKQEPELADQILFGVACLLETEKRFVAHIHESFEAGRSSLVDPSGVAVAA